MLPLRNFEIWHVFVRVSSSGMGTFVKKVKAPRGKNILWGGGGGGLFAVLGHTLRSATWHSSASHLCMHCMYQDLPHPVLYQATHITTFFPIVGAQKFIPVSVSDMKASVSPSLHSTGCVTQWKSRWNFTSSSSSIFLVYNVCCDKCIQRTYLKVSRLSIELLR